MKTIEGFKSDDGILFETKKECLLHEAEIKLQEFLTDLQTTNVKKIGWSLVDEYKKILEILKPLSTHKG